MQLVTTKEFRYLTSYHPSLQRDLQAQMVHLLVYMTGKESGYFNTSRRVFFFPKIKHFIRKKKKKKI